MNKYLRAISFNFIFFTLSTIFFLVVTPLAIKVMGEEFYGLWVLLTVLLLFSNVGNLGIDAIVMKFSSESPTQDGEVTQPSRVITAGYLVALALSGITAVILLLTRNLIADHIGTSAALKEQFRVSLLWVAASIPPQFLAFVPQGFLLSQLRNRAVRQIELFSSVTLWLGAIGLAAIEKNLVPIAIWCFMNRVLILGISFAVSQPAAPLRPRIDKPTLSKMLNFSKYMFIESLAISLFQHFDKVIVGFTLGPVLSGVYSVGSSLALRLTIVTGQATEVMIPYASQNSSRNDQKKLYGTFRQLSAYTSLLLAGLSSVLIIWMDEILILWISPDYAGRYANAFRIFVVAYSLLSLCRPAHQTLTGLGKVKFTATTYFLSTSIMLIATFFLSRGFGLPGAVASKLVLVSLLVFNLSVYNLLQSPMRWEDALEDLRWGLITPILVYGLYGLFPSFSLGFKAVETIVIGGILFVWLIRKDVFIKTKLFQRKQIKIEYQDK